MLSQQDLFFTWEKACQYPVYYQSIAHQFCIYIYQMYDLYTYVYIELEEREREVLLLNLISELGTFGIFEFFQ